MYERRLILQLHSAAWRYLVNTTLSLVTAAVWKANNSLIDHDERAYLVTFPWPVLWTSVRKQRVLYTGNAQFEGCTFTSYTSRTCRISESMLSARIHSKNVFIYVMTSKGKRHRHIAGGTGINRLYKGKSVPLEAWSGPEGSRKLRFPDFMTTAQKGGKVVSIMHRPHLPSGNYPGTHFCQRLSRPQGHSAIRRIMWMKNSNDTIWDRTSDLPIFSTAP